MNVPTSYGALKLKDFLVVYDILESKADEFDKRLKIISHFLGYDANEIPFKQTGLKRFYKPNLNYYLKRASKLISSEKPKYVKNNIWIGNKRYYTDLDAEALNTNQYTALTTYTQNGQAEKNIVKALGILFYRHKLFTTPTFDDTKLKEVHSDLMEARLKDVYGVLVFFCKVVEQLNAIFPAYLILNEIMIEKEIAELTRTLDLERNTVGGTS